MRNYFLSAILCFVGVGQADESALMIPQSSLVESLPLLAQDEVEVVSQLIASTQRQLDAQVELKCLMQELKEQEEAFFNGVQTKPHAAKMVRTARRLLVLITDLHLQHLFSSQYMEELTLFSSIAGKSTPPRPYTK